MSIHIQTPIDQPFIDQAEQEIFQILMSQHQIYLNDWNTRFRPKLRMFGLGISLFGLVVSISTIVYLKVKYGDTTCLNTSITQLSLYAFLMLVLGAIFYLLPQKPKTISGWAMKAAIRNFRKIAGNCVKQAKKSLPFTAEYDIDAESISYYRSQHDERRQAWRRKLKGIAVHASLVTLFFKRRTSMSPIMVILHEDFAQLKPALEQQEIPFQSITMETTD